MSTEADEQAARAAEQREAQRRAAILEKIRTLELKVDECESLCYELQTSKTCIDDQIGQWVSQYNNEMQKEIVKFVKVTDVFEGVVAEQLSKDFSETLEEMNGNKEESEDLSNKIQWQIGSLQEYIDKLKSEIRSLYASL